MSFQKLSVEVKSMEATLIGIEKSVTDLKKGTPIETEWIPLIKLEVPAASESLSQLKDEVSRNY